MTVIIIFFTHQKGAIFMFAIFFQGMAYRFSGIFLGPELFLRIKYITHGNTRKIPQDGTIICI